jgi:hypothetical protein
LTTDCSGSVESTLVTVLSGNASYNQTTCELVDNTQAIITTTPPGTSVTVAPAGKITLCPTSDCRVTWDCSTTRAVGTSTGACCPLAPAGTQRFSGSQAHQLTEEDTVQDALARATPVLGQASSAIISSFDSGTFCFTAQTSIWTANFSGLNPACSYKFKVTYTRDTAGGGTETLTEETDFSPGGDTYILQGEIPAVIDFNTQFTSAELSFT